MASSLLLLGDDTADNIADQSIHSQSKQIFDILFKTATIMNINVSEAIKYKMNINNAKYPKAHVQKGDESKYTKYAKMSEITTKENSCIIHPIALVSGNNKEDHDLLLQNIKSFKYSLTELITVIEKFGEERGWQDDYTIENLFFCIGSEIGELSDLIRFMKNTTNLYELEKSVKQDIIQEIADIFIFLIRLFLALEQDIYKMSDDLKDGIIC